MTIITHNAAIIPINIFSLFSSLESLSVSTGVVFPVGEYGGGRSRNEHRHM